MTRIYEHWRQLRGDKRLSPWRRARLAAAMETFKTVPDLLRLARFWRDSGSSQAEEKVRLCLKMAETMATTRDDWGEIAVQYSKHLWIFGRHLGNEALRCMRRAEAVAETSVDWAGFAIDWYRLSGTDTRRQLLRCLGTALAKAKTTHDFGTMASYCMLIFNNLPAAEVLLREAEYRAVAREDWEEIRGIYETSFDDARRAFLSEYPPEVPFEIVNGRVIETDG